jgi:hypothetical protein
VEFAEAWGVLARSLSYYPPTNDRVRLALGQTLEAYSQARDELGGDVTLLLSRREVLIGREATALQPGSNLAWLSERLERSGLAGATFEPGLDQQGLLAFTQQLLAGYRRTLLDPEFEQAASERVPCVVPVQQRFEGSFKGGADEHEESWLEALVAAHPAARTDPLALIAARDGRVRQRVDGLLESLGTEPGGEGPSVKAADLLTQLVHTLPAEATHREEDLVRFTVEMLDAVQAQVLHERQTAAGGAWGDAFDDSPVAQALAEVCRRLFAREGRPSEELAQRRIEGDEPQQIAPWMRGHPLDERIGDDVGALVDEVAALPACRPGELSLEDAREVSEQLGVYLHYLTTLDSDEEAARTWPLAAACIRSGSAPAREVLRLYLEPLREAEPREEDERHSGRVLTLLRETGLTDVLVEEEVFSDATVVDVFPRHFGPWLDGLDLTSTAGRERLLEVCGQLGPERLRGASEALQGPDGILTTWRVCQILSTPAAELGPLVRILLTRADAETKTAVVRFLVRVAGRCSEACLLDLLEVGELPRDYLAELADPSDDPAVRRRMHTRIADILAEHIEQWQDEPRMALKRLRAVGLLGTFHSRHAEAVLRQLARRGVKLFRSDGESALQHASREALRSYSS